MKNVLEKILKTPTETDKIEFKRLGGENKAVKKILETVVAMANTNGGDIILGVDDPEKTAHKKAGERIFGIEENKDNYDALVRELGNIMPPITNYEMHDIDAGNNKTVVRLHVPKAAEKFHIVNNKVWIRLTGSNKELTPHEAIDFNYARGFKRAEEELVGVDFDLLNTEYFNTWRATKKGVSDRDVVDILFRTGLAKKNDEGQMQPTRAAVLLFAEFPTNIMDTKCAIRVMQIQGKHEKFGKVPNYLETPKTFSGPLIKQIQETHEHVLSLLRDGIKIKSGFVSRYKIPERAVKEAITNAVIHRDYHTQQDIEIRIFEDRVEVLSPGLFPYNITVENIGIERAVNKRNKLIADHLREFPEAPNFDLMEGVRAMRSEMSNENLFPPIFITYPDLKNAVRVVLLNEKRPDEWEKVRLYLEKEGSVNNEKAREVTGVTQRDDMSRMLAKWVEKNLLHRVSPGGSKQHTYYTLQEKKRL